MQYENNPIVEEKKEKSIFDKSKYSIEDNPLNKLLIFIFLFLAFDRLIKSNDIKE